jgi:hypothetical protein
MAALMLPNAVLTHLKAGLRPAALYRLRFLGHQLEPYAAAATDESCF